MEHVVRQPRAPFTTADGSLEVVQVPAARDNLVWVIACTRTGQAAIVDGPDAGAALDAIAARGWTLAAVLNSHTHWDHIGVNDDLAKRGLLDGLRVYGPARKSDDVPGLTDPVDEGDVVPLGEARLRVWLTEGHIDGHVSYLCDDVLFCGDTLFAGGCGYLFDGPPSKMFSSLMRLASLPGGTRVCCAHEYTEDNLRFAWLVEPDNAALAERIRQVWALRAEGGCTVPSTIAEEQATNPFLRPGSTTLVATLAERMPEAERSTHAAIFAATRALKDRKDHRERDDAVLPLQSS